MRDRLLAVGYSLLLALLLLVAVALFFRALGSERGRVTYSFGIPFDWRIVDGDTFSTTSRPRKYFRLVGYDAPETTRPRCEEELLLGTKATTRLKSLLESPNLLLLQTGDYDRYGRSLVHAWVAGARVARLMIEANLGVESDGTKRRYDWCSALRR